MKNLCAHVVQCEQRVYRIPTLSLSASDGNFLMQFWYGEGVVINLANSCSNWSSVMEIGASDCVLDIGERIGGSISV